MKLLSIVGRSGSGKTSLLEKLIPTLKARGLRVACVKHSHHVSLHVDREGKDSWRLREAGADAVALLTRDSMVLFESLPEELDVSALLKRLPPVDLVLVESWKSQRLPCVEVIGPSGDRVPAELLGPRVCVAAATNAPRESTGTDDQPGSWLDRDDVAAIAGRILTALEPDPS